MHLFPKAGLTEWSAAHFNHTCDTLMLIVRERLMVDYRPAPPQTGPLLCADSEERCVFQC